MGLYKKYFWLSIVCFLGISDNCQSIVYAQTKRFNYVLEDELHQSYPFQKNGILSVENVNGSIIIESWDKDEVDIEVIEHERNGGYDIEIEVLTGPDKISIFTHHPKTRLFRDRSSSANYTIKVPREIELSAESTNGKIEIRNTRGAVNAETTNGSVSVYYVEGDTEVKTTNGKITLEDIEGSVRTVTTNAAIRLNNLTSSNIYVKTTNAAIDGDFNVDEKGRYEFVTTNGRVTLRIPENAKAALDAHYTNGSFSTDFDIGSAEGRSRNRRSRDIQGDINGGGASISIRTTNGSIKLLSK
ncbi:DUF4097 domain-containing protein [candidate division KSB1 bacterium]